MAKHCTSFEVDLINDRLKEAKIKQHTLADLLGVSRTQVNLMLNHYSPMRTVYRLAINDILNNRKTCP